MFSVRRVAGLSGSRLACAHCPPGCLHRSLEQEGRESWAQWSALRQAPVEDDVFPAAHDVQLHRHPRRVRRGDVAKQTVQLLYLRYSCTVLYLGTFKTW